MLRPNPYLDGRQSPIHQLDPRVKLIFLLTMLLALAALRHPSLLQVLAYLLFMVLIASTARLPLFHIASTSTLVLPFVCSFCLIVYLAGDHGRAWAILAKSYLSALTVLVCMTTTSFSDLISAALYFKFPSLLLGITQVIYRYLFVLTEQVRTMQVAFQARGGRSRRLAALASAGIIAVLFSRSYEKAAVVNHAMLSRSYVGSLPFKSFAPFKYLEIGALVLGFAFAAALQFL